MKILVVVLFVLVQSALPEECPFNCRCTKYKIFCRDSRMRSLPQGHSTTTLISIKGDVLSTLNQSVVSKPGLGNLTTLELVQTNIEVIRSHTFVKLRELESLTINQNNVTDLQPGAFLGLDKLIKLDLTSNRLKNLSSGAFEGLLGLRYLNLADNRIKEIHSGMFDGMRRDCSSEKVKTLGRIDLSGNYILIIDEEAFRGVCFLNFLTISACHGGCNFTSASAHFKSIFSLRSLVIMSGRWSINLTMSLQGLINLRHLKMNNTGLTKIQNHFLEGSKLLRTLFIVKNKVQELEVGCFQGLQSLSELDLRDNRLSFLPDGVFRDLQSLQKLDLSYNSLEIIPENLFKGLGRLRILYLRYNKISSLEGNAFSNLHSLRELFVHINYYYPDADNPALTSIIHRFKILERIDSDAFSGLFSLKFLHLPFCSKQSSSNVALQSLDRLDNFQGPDYFEFDNLQVVKNLNFSISGDLTPSSIQKLLRKVNYLQRPVSLEMFGFNTLAGLGLISGIPIDRLYIIKCEPCVIGKNSFVGFSELNSLTMLTASKIQIEQEAFSGLKTLQILQLYSETGFDFAPGVFQELGMLEILILQGEDLSTEGGLFFSQDQLKWLVNINKLTLLENNITSLGEGIFLELENLVSIDLSFNKISSLDSAHFRGLRNLKKLDLSDNIISTLSVVAFDWLRSIDTIDLSGNEIGSIGFGVFGAICDDNFTLSCANLTQVSKYCNTSFALGTLKNLDLSHNRIKFIHKHAFLGCNKLQELDLNVNNLQTLDFLYTPQLIFLDFSDNENVTEISNDTYRCTPMLEKVTMRFNNVKLMQINALNQLKNLKEIYLPEMNYDCWQQQIWIWLRSRNILYDSDDDIDLKLSKLQCNSSLDGTNHPRNESSTANAYLYFKIYIEPIVFIFIFLSGCFGNGLLLFIVFSHSDMRNRKNACVAHLAFSDILSLVLNLALSYWDVLHVTWDLGETICKIFITSKDLVVALVVFSVVALTFERYLVVQSFNNLKSPHGNSGRPIVFIVIVWMYALVSSIPSYFHATVEGRCLSSLPGRHDYVQRQWSFQLLMNCILPVASIISLNLLSAYTLKKSIREVPGKIRNKSRDASRNTVANLVMILSLVFTLSSLPNFLLRTLVSWSVWSFEEVFWYSFVTYCLFFFHTIFNPFALFVMGSKYKSHIKEYVRFLIKEREHIPKPPDVKKELYNVCDVLQHFGQKVPGTHQEEGVEEPDDIDVRDEVVRRARQERLKNLQARFL